MKTKNISVKVKNDKVILPKDLCFTTGNINRYNIALTLPNEWNGLIVYMLFDGIQCHVEDNCCSVPEFSKAGSLTIGVVGYEMEEGKLVMRFSPEPGKAYVTRGSYSEDAQEQEPPQPDIYEALLKGVHEATDTARAVEKAVEEIAKKIENGELGTDNDSPLITDGKGSAFLGSSKESAEILKQLMSDESTDETGSVGIAGKYDIFIVTGLSEDILEAENLEGIGVLGIFPKGDEEQTTMIMGVGDPEEDLDAVNKRYVDSLIKDVVSSQSPPASQILTYDLCGSEIADILKTRQKQSEILTGIPAYGSGATYIFSVSGIAVSETAGVIIDLSASFTLPASEGEESLVGIQYPVTCVDLSSEEGTSEIWYFGIWYEGNEIHICNYMPDVPDTLFNGETVFDEIVLKQATVTVILPSEYEKIHAKLYTSTENIKEATCILDGTHDEVVYCENCEKEISRETIIDAPMHPDIHTYKTDSEGNEVFTTIKSATCEDAGIEEIRCQHCGTAKEGSRREIPAAGHKQGELKTVYDASCDYSGLKQAHCTKCGAVCYEEVIEPTGHEWDNVYTVEKKATCTAPGIESIRCTKCGARSEPREIPKAEHNTNIHRAENKVNPTCTVDGSYETVVYCSMCGQIQSRTPGTTPTMGHSFSKWEAVETPGCDDSSIQHRVCSKCGFISVKDADFSAHEIPIDENGEKVYEVVEPTETTDGHKYLRCSRCRAIIESESIPALRPQNSTV